MRKRETKKTDALQFLTMKIDFELEATLVESDDVEFTGPLGGWPFPLVNIFLVDDNRISDAADLVEQVNEASEC